MKPLFRSAILLCLMSSLIGLTASTLRAAERRFAFSYEATTMPRGAWEFEPWTTFKHYSDRDVFEFRYELEYGVTDRFQLGAYLSDWSYEDGGRAEWQHAGLEGIYTLTNPATDWLASALYGEVLIGPEAFKLEGKLLLQKNFGSFTLVYNAIIEAEWEGQGYDEKVGVWENTLGLCYNISPGFSIGVEAVHELEFEDWADAGDHVVFVGPNLSWRSKNCYATLAGLFQASNVDGEPESQVRLLLGFDF